MNDNIKVDIIVISDSHNDELKKITTDMLVSLYESETNIDFLTYVIESSDADFAHINKNITMLRPEKPFGYHKYLNIGIKNSSSEYILLANNDLLFTKNWASELIKEMDNDPNLLSVSPYSDIPHSTLYSIQPNSDMVLHGYTVTRELCGWAIFQKRKIYDIIGDLDENFIFWYADNDYSNTLIKYGVKHALITNSIVNHMTSKTLNGKSSEEFNELTNKQFETFLNKWK